MRSRGIKQLEEKLEKLLSQAILPYRHLMLIDYADVAIKWTIVRLKLADNKEREINAAMSQGGNPI